MSATPNPGCCSKHRARARERIIAVPLPVRSGPLAFSEYGHASAVSIEPVDIDLVGTDHPVDVDETRIAALGGDLLRRQLRSVDEAFRIALAERDVAGGVFVEQRVEEQQAAFRNR